MILHVNAQQDLLLGRLTSVALPVHFADPGGSLSVRAIRQRNVGPMSCGTSRVQQTLPVNFYQHRSLLHEYLLYILQTFKKVVGLI